MVDFSCFARSFFGPNLVASSSPSMLAMFFFIALYMQNLHYSPLQAGVRFLQRPPDHGGGPAVGRLTDRIGHDR